MNNIGKIIAQTEKMIEKETPRLKFCWHCGRKLRANFFKEYKADDGNTYIVHRQCKEILEGKQIDFELEYV